MFWTAFIWGLGASCGAAFGLLLFIVLLCFWQMVAHSEKAKRANELAERANAALVRRDYLTEVQIEKLESLARSAEFACEIMRNR